MLAFSDTLGTRPKWPAFSDNFSDNFGRKPIFKSITIQIFGYSIKLVAVSKHTYIIMNALDLSALEG